MGVEGLCRDRRPGEGQRWTFQRASGPWGQFLGLVWAWPPMIHAEWAGWTSSSQAAVSRSLVACGKLFIAAKCGFLLVNYSFLRE
jgi:hypothetical protein